MNHLRKSYGSSKAIKDRAEACLDELRSSYLMLFHTIRGYNALPQATVRILLSMEDKLVIKREEDPESIIEWIRKRKRRMGGKTARLGDLAGVYLEEEFNDEGIQ